MQRNDTQEPEEEHRPYLQPQVKLKVNTVVNHAVMTLFLKGI